MNYGDEQNNELEALSEIYFNEIKFISKEQPISFSIKVRPQASSYDENEQAINNENQYENNSDNDEDQSEDDEGESIGDDDNINQQSQDISVELRFDLPEKYPDEKPSIQIIDSQNLDQNDLLILMDNLNQKAEESLGTVMVFMLVSDVVEWLITKTEENAIELAQEKENKLKEIEQEEKKIFEGTPVTESTFLAWKAKFDAEMLKTKFEQQKQQNEPGSTKGLTGREMFESDKTLAQSDLNFMEDLDQNQIEALLHNIEELDVNEEEAEFDTEGSEDDDYECELDDEDFDDVDDEDEDEEEEEQKQEEKRVNNVKSKQKTKSKQKIIKSNT